jgi:transposase-like protein
MTETAGTRGASKADQWRVWIAEQERSGRSARQFCKEQGLSEQSFYAWRRRFRRQQQPVRFALVEREGVPQKPATEAALELVLTTGERLRMGVGVDAATLRTVLAVLRP